LEKPLLHRVSDGDPGAMQECITRFAGLLWSLTRRAGFADTEAEDAVQEIFTEIWRNGAKYDPNIASDTAFIATIARRRLIDRRRRLGRKPTPQPIIADEGLPPSNSEPKTELGEEAAKASQALQLLSPEQQRVLRLSVYEGLSHELIARATGLPLGTVKTHARRGLMRLREMLAGNGDESAQNATQGAAQEGGK
jgi:RNA polymerase sigma-70 factor (ECF subfamily)